MKRKRYTEEQIAFALRQAESGTSVSEIVRKMGISEQPFQGAGRFHKYRREVRMRRFRGGDKDVAGVHV